MLKTSFSRLFKDIAVYGFGDLLLRATAVITLPIYTRVFTPAEYGVLSFVITVVNLLSAVLTLGLASAYALYFFEAKTLPEKRVVTSTCIGFLAAWSGVVTVACLPLCRAASRWSFGTDEYGPLFALAVLTVPVNLVNAMCGQALRNQFRPGLFTGLNVATALLTVGFGLAGAVGLRLGLAGVVGGGLLASCLMLPARVWTVRDLLRPAYSVAMLRELLSYGLPLVPMTLAYWVFEVSDRLILGKLSTLEQLGLYAVASGLTTVLAFINGALGQAWSPHAVSIRLEQPEVAPAFFGQMMTYLVAGFGLLCVGITAFGPEVLMLLSSPRFYAAAAAIGPLALGFVAYASTQVTASGLALSKKTKYFTLYSWIAAALNIGLNLAFVPRWGMMAAAWSTAASYGFLTVAYMISSQRFWAVAYERRRTAVAAALTFCFTVTAPLLPEVWLVAGLAVKGAYCSAYAAALFLFGVLDRREVDALLGWQRGLWARGAREDA